MLYFKIWCTIFFVIIAILVIFDSITFSNYRQIKDKIMRVSCWVIFLMTFIWCIFLMWS